jgi:hypothetical protein
MPRPEIAALLHARRYTRYLVLDRDVRTPAGGLCAWCGNPRPKGRRKYCGPACANEANIRAGGAWVEAAVFARDRGICAACGMDCEWVAAQKRAMWAARRSWEYGAAERMPGSWGPWSYHGRLWQADHIRPVAEGGGVCGLENYQTLCLRCHKLDTAELAGRLADRRKGQGRLAI